MPQHKARRPPSKAHHHWHCPLPMHTRARANRVHTTVPSVTVDLPAVSYVSRSRAVRKEWDVGSPGSSSFMASSTRSMACMVSAIVSGLTLWLPPCSKPAMRSTMGTFRPSRSSWTRWRRQYAGGSRFWARHSSRMAAAVLKACWPDTTYRSLVPATGGRSKGEGGLARGRAWKRTGPRVCHIPVPHPHRYGVCTSGRRGTSLPAPPLDSPKKNQDHKPPPRGQGKRTTVAHCSDEELRGRILAELSLQGLDVGRVDGADL